jgi:hypothetical protein
MPAAARTQIPRVARDDSGGFEFGMTAEGF